MNGPFDNDNQFVVSYELLMLFRWLSIHEQEGLKKLIHKALKHGLEERMRKQPMGPEESQEELQQSVIDYFALMETLMYELFHEQEIRQILDRHMIPEINNIDLNVCDKQMVSNSLAKATQRFESNPFVNPKDALCKELLKQWKPAKKSKKH